MSTDFIRQFRSQPRHRWYSPLLVLALAALFYGVGVVIQFLGFFVWALVFIDGAGGDFDAFADSIVDFNTLNGMVNGLVSVILMLMGDLTSGLQWNQHVLLIIGAFAAAFVDTRLPRGFSQ